MSLSWVSCRSSILVQLEFGDVGFCGGSKTGEPGEKPSEQGENEQQTQPNPTTLVGGECFYHWAIPAPANKRK